MLPRACCAVRRCCKPWTTTTTASTRTCIGACTTCRPRRPQHTRQLDKRSAPRHTRFPSTVSTAVVQLLRLVELISPKAAQVASFVNADSWREIVFTRNASEAVNLIAHAWGTANLKPGDEVCVLRCAAPPSFPCGHAGVLAVAMRACLCVHHVLTKAFAFTSDTSPLRLDDCSQRASTTAFATCSPSEA